MANGVYQVKNGKWVVSVWSGGKLRNAGTYLTKEEAEAGREEAKRLVLSGDVELKNFSRPVKPLIHVSDRLRSIVIGSLLGDGSISKTHSQVHNSFFVKKQARFREEYVKWHRDEFGELAGGICYGTGQSPSYPERVTRHCRFYSKCDRYFTELRRAWYPEGTKVVPSGLSLDPLSLAVWFADDGVHSCRSIYFCADGFTNGCRSLLVSRLREFGLDCGSPRLHVVVYRRSHEAFLELIRPYFTWGCFQYKLDGSGFTEYRRHDV